MLEDPAAGVRPEVRKILEENIDIVFVERSELLDEAAAGARP